LVSVGRRLPGLPRVAEVALGLRLRSVLVRPGRDLLGGKVEVDETYIGGAEEAAAGRPL